MRRINNRSTQKQVYIIGDGHSEKIYFEQLKVNEDIKGLNIKPELPVHSGYKSIFTKAKAYIKEDKECKVYCLIDFDKIVEEGKVKQFNKDLEAVLKNKQIQVFINNPCFEFWFLCHFEKRTGAFKNCDAVANELKKYVTDYCKRQDYLRKKGIYSHLRPNMVSHAIPNSEFLESDRENRSDYYPRSEVYKLLKVLLNHG